MTTITTGTFFLNGSPRVISGSADEFEIEMMAYDRQGAHKLETYRLRFKGEPARAWLRQHQDELVAGRALFCTLINPRTYLGMRHVPVTHADVDGSHPPVLMQRAAKAADKTEAQAT